MGDIKKVLRRIRFVPMPDDVPAREPSPDPAPATPEPVKTPA